MLSTESRMRGNMQVRVWGAGTGKPTAEGGKASCTEPTYGAEVAI